MDAKSKAEFINAVADGNVVSCSKCGTNNKSDNKYCIVCGAEIATQQEANNNVPAFESTKEFSEPVKVTIEEEPFSVFAQGLPEWNIEPPQIMVRRH